MPRVLLAIAAVLVLSGCVWSRLLDWKGQLKEFDRYVTAVDEGPELILQFKQPVIRPGDIGYLFGSETPSKRTDRAGGGIYASWVLRRDRADSIGLDIALGAADAKEETLADSLRVPSQVLAFIPKQRLLATARAFGSAEIDKGKREAAAGLSGEDAKPIRPGRAVVVAALGEPDASERIGDVDRMTFTFKLVAPDGKLGKPTDLIIDLRGDLLVAARLKAPNFNAWMEFDKK
jgi:hypothetical protein